MKTKNKGKEVSKKANQKNIKGKDKKIEDTEEEEKEIEEIPKEKPYNLERFIYITDYNDGDLMFSLKKLFEEINQKAFSLLSTKEIYTRNLTESERDNNEIDYISGFQLIDKTYRITILEGITGLGMKIVKETLPKTNLNNKNLKIFSNSKILFNKRIYSKFNLCLKFIKLSRNLQNILQTYEIYEKAHRCREVYDSFQIFGSLLRAKTMEEISSANLFPEAEHLLILERKYGDLLTEQDMTGIYKEKKNKKRIKLSDLIGNSNKIYSDKNNRTSSSGNYSSSSSEPINNKNNTIKIKNTNKCSNTINVENNDLNIDKIIMPKIQVSKSQINIMKKKNNFNEEIRNIHKLILKQKTDSKNEAYDKLLKEKKLRSISKSQIWQNNLNYINHLKNTIPLKEKFCKPYPKGTDIIEKPKEILFCSSKSNYYEAIVKKMREKYLKDKNHYYSYSDYSLALSFPMIERERNVEYLNYIENKSKWINEKDFERYKQPEREKYYFPKINNIL